MSSADRHEAGPGISVCVVTHDSADALRRSLPPLVSELRPGDELIVCDNRSTDGTPAVVRELAPVIKVKFTGIGKGECPDPACKASITGLCTDVREIFHRLGGIEKAVARMEGRLEK